MQENSKKALKATTLALIANTAFPTIAHNDDAAAIDWDRMIKDPVMTASDAPTRPGAIGDRINVSTLESEFNGVGRILNNGRNQCTGNIVVIDGYNTFGEGILVSTAAHCLDDGIRAENITFSIDFINAEDNVEVHTFRYPLMWLNPDYQSVEDIEHDQALLFFPNQEAPEEIIPSELEIYSAHLMRDFGTYEFQGAVVTSAGYSTDMDGLSIDRNCQIRFTEDRFYPILRTDCSLSYGASGGGLITDIREDGQLVISAITSTRSIHLDVTHENFRSSFALMYHSNLAQVPFLMKDEICARVTAPSGLNLRDYNYHDEGSELLTLPMDSIVYVTDMLYDEQEQYGSDDVWLEVRLPENADSMYPTGYSNSAYLEEAPCPSR
jgi:hypothetical protein